LPSALAHGVAEYDGSDGMRARTLALLANAGLGTRASPPAAELGTRASPPATGTAQKNLPL